MDDNTAQDPNTTQTPFFSAEDADALFDELRMGNLPLDRKQQMLDQMIDTIMKRIFLRIEPILTEQDKQILDDFSLKEGGEDYIMPYLIGKVPNINQIAAEEILTYKTELKLQISAIVDILDEEAAKVNGSDEQSSPTDRSDQDQMKSEESEKSDQDQMKSEETAPEENTQTSDLSDVSDLSEGETNVSSEGEATASSDPDNSDDAPGPKTYNDYID